MTRQAGTGGQTSNIQNLAYQWDDAGNLSSRQDLRQSLTESFTYDALDRLTNASGPGAQSLSVGYDAIGNVTSRTDVGSYAYHATRKHAVVSAGSNTYAYDSNGNMSTRNGSTITWTSYNLPASLSAGGYTATFNYAPDRSRWRQISTYSGGNETTIYVGGLVEKLTTSTRVHWKHRIPTPSGEVQVIRRSDGTNDVFYVTTDHLGSTDAVMDAAGAVLVRESFAAYGARRGSNWASSTAPDWVGIANSTRRGYTGHEQLDNVLLVHMNGRVYDPAIGRFLSADPYVKSMDASQGWNRYAYVSNNPLAFTDPSGFADERPPHPLPVLPSELPPADPKDTIFVNGRRVDLSWVWVRLDAREMQRGAELNRSNNQGDGAASGAGGGDGSDNKTKPPCDSAGGAPSPQQYQSQGQHSAQRQAYLNSVDDGSGAAASAGLLLGLLDLVPFRRGGALDGQAYGSSPAYANYAFGVYMSAADYSLSTALVGANVYGAVRSQYPATTVMSPKYPSIPDVNVSSITNGFNAQQDETLCTTTP